MNPVVHFEMPYEDGKRMMDFYTQAFGWESKQYGPELGNYIVAMTTESDEKTGRPKTPGSINGGFYAKPEDPMGQAPSVVISVANVEEAMQNVTNAGGKVLGEPMDIPGVGKYVSFLDSEGNRVSMLEPLAMQ